MKAITSMKLSSALCLLLAVGAAARHARRRRRVEGALRRSRGEGVHTGSQRLGASPQRVGVQFAGHIGKCC